MSVFAVHIVPSEVTPILLGLDMLREFGLVINADSAHCYSAKLRARGDNWDKPLLDVIIIDCLCHYH